MIIFSLVTLNKWSLSIGNHRPIKFYGKVCKIENVEGKTSCNEEMFIIRKICRSKAQGFCKEGTFKISLNTNQMPQFT